MTSIEMPRVSIGIPVYNGERYLVETLDSVLGQTYTDMEIVISDNGSTDSTESICRTYAAKDDRIKYFRYSENRGAAWNYNNVFLLAKGEYFKWAAADDVLAPTLIEKCVKILINNPAVVLCYARTQAIDADSTVIREYPSKPKGMDPRADERFFEFVCVPHPCVSVFGLMRRDVLAKTKLIGKYSGSDRPLLGELALRGQLYEIPEFLFFYRNHEDQSWGGNRRTHHAQQAWYDPKRAGRITFPHWRLMSEHLQTIQRVSLSPSERAKCYSCMLQWSRRRWRYLAANLVLQDAW